MREARRWVIWNLEARHGHPTKVPYQAECPSTRASSTDPTTWSDFDTAHAAVEDGKADGVGFVLGDGYVGVDLDACRDPETGVMTAEAQRSSTSSRATRRSARAAPACTSCCGASLLPGGRRQGHVEIYADGRYFTVTGHHLEGTPTTIEERTAELAALHGRLFGPNGGNGNDHRSVPRPVASVADDDAVLLERARGASNGAKFSALWAGDTTAYASSSEADLALCRLLAFWTHGDAGRIDRLFRQSGLFREKWDERHGAQTYGELTIEKAIAGCREFYSGARPTPIATANEPTSRPGSAPEIGARPPHAQSRRPVGERARLRGALVCGRWPHGAAPPGRRVLRASARHSAPTTISTKPRCGRRCTCSWKTRNGGRHRRASQPRTLEAFKPTKSKVDNVLDALRAVCNLPASCAPPCWLQDDPGLDPFEVVACHNGLLHIPTRELLPPTPAFFTLHGLDFAVDPHAPPPVHWLRFLDDLWPADQASRDTLQEWIGYCLTPRTHLQKICLLVGPKRSGKSTIGRVMRRLLGERHVSGPTLANISEQFGLSILIGKTVAIIADARISGRTDTAVLTERLLSISGEDTLSIPRKFLPDWNGKLTTRFLLMTNELPRIEDASGALASRFLVLTLQRVLLRARRSRPVRPLPPGTARHPELGARGLGSALRPRPVRATAIGRRPRPGVRRPRESHRRVRPGTLRGGPGPTTCPRTASSRRGRPGARRTAASGPAPCRPLAGISGPSCPGSAKASRASSARGSGTTRGSACGTVTHEDWHALARDGTRVAQSPMYTRGDIKQQRSGPRASRVSLDSGVPRDTWRLNDHRVEVLITCPKCGETRLIERVDAHRWFCAVCAHSWTIGTKDVSREP